MKTIKEIVHRDILDNLLKIPYFEALDVKEFEAEKKVGNETVTERGTRYDVEVPTGNGAYSRLRFTIKVVGKEPVIKEAECDEGVYIKPKNLAVSFLNLQNPPALYCVAESMDIVT